MPINTNLLISAAMLQDLIVDKIGNPMIAGTITCYHDNSRTTLKNWYYQSGTPGNYNYVPLPNPLTLSAAGTICDINGVDTIPFFYPYLETEGNIDTPQPDPYYIYIASADGQTIITRQNFPFLGATSVQPSPGSIEFNNLIVNGGFWRNNAPNSIPITPYQSITLGSAKAPTFPSSLTNWIDSGIQVAPSQHDGFTMPDIRFYRNNASSADSLTFIPFPLNNQQIISNTIFPEYYASHVSTASAGETYKYYQFPIDLHVNKLANTNYTVSLLANSPQSVTIQLLLFQYAGSGVASNTPIVVANKSIVLSPAWTQYTLTDIFPVTTGLTLGNGGDDAYYLQVSLPINKNYTVNFTGLSLYLTNGEIPSNDYSTYDKINSIISSPRTGDIRTSLNQYYYFGWVPMNNGSIGNVSSNATARANADTWQLFNLIWQQFSSYNIGTSNPLAQMYNSSGAAVSYGINPITDFNANNSIVLTTTMGKVLLGTVPSSVLQATYQTTFSATNVAGNLVIVASSNVSFYNGMPITFNANGGALPSGLSAFTIYYVSSFSGTTSFNVATSFANAMAGTVLSFVSTGSGNPIVSSALAGTSTGEYAHTQLSTELATHSHNPLSPNSSFLGGATPGTAALSGGSGVGTVATTATAGSSTPFNVTQPGYFMNIYIKL